MNEDVKIGDVVKATRFPVKTTSTKERSYHKKHEDNIIGKVIEIYDGKKFKDIPHSWARIDSNGLAYFTDDLELIERRKDNE